MGFNIKVCASCGNDTPENISYTQGYRVECGECGACGPFGVTGANDSAQRWNFMQSAIRSAKMRAFGGE